VTEYFFIIAVGIIAGGLLLDYLRIKVRLHQLERQQEEAAADLKKQRDHIFLLREENTLLQNKLRHSFEDTVTKLLGWQLFEDRLNQNLKESERYQLTMGVLFIDIDDFRMINDGLNYETGDALLQQVGERLQACIRQVDSVSRFSKDTFVILVTQLAKPETAAIVAQRVLRALQEPFMINSRGLCITACIGIAVYPSDGQDASTLLRNADHALHLAKAKGKQIYQFFQEKMHDKSQRELSLASSLNRENVFNEFALYFQPIMNVDTKTIIGMDAMLYWQHPELGLVAPAEVSAYAEKQHKSNVVSEWLLRHACQQFMHWRTLGFEPDMLGVTVSLKQLDNSHFIYRISQILQELSFKPEWLVLEIYENASLVPETLEKAFNMLRYMGVKIAIDNFGSGTFSLCHLKDYPVDYIKLDKLFIENLHHARTLALLESVVGLAKHLSMQVLARDIDTQEQADQLQRIGCILMQGKLFGEPMPEAEVIGKVKVT
jgi:diguanylate cyclase (GGDEF)-like protein